MTKLDLEAVLNLKREQTDSARDPNTTRPKTVLQLKRYICCTILLWEKERKKESYRKLILHFTVLSGFRKRFSSHPVCS